MRISLNAYDFERLVRGEIITKNDVAGRGVVEIALQDIGFDVMASVIAKAVVR